MAYIDVFSVITSAPSAPGIPASLTNGNVLVGNSSNQASAVSITGDISLTNLGVTAIASSAVMPQDLSSSGAPSWVFNSPLTSNGQLIGKGSATNDSAATGYIGESATTSITTFINAPGNTGDWSDMIPLVLTSGDWDVNLMTTMKLNGSIMTQFDVGISQTSGNSATGLTEAVNWLQSAALPIGTVHQAVAIPAVRQSLNVTTTLYAKLNVTYSAGNPQFQCRLSARRMR